MEKQKEKRMMKNHMGFGEGKQATVGWVQSQWWRNWRKRGKLTIFIFIQFHFMVQVKLYYSIKWPSHLGKSSLQLPIIKPFLQLALHTHTLHYISKHSFSIKFLNMETTKIDSSPPNACIKQSDCRNITINNHEKR